MTHDSVVVSTIGAVLRRRGIGVSELQRRLAGRGIHVSRGALDRLASDRPLRLVNFDLLLPILEELGITLGDPFRTLPRQELDRQRAATSEAQQATQMLTSSKPGATVAALLDGADRADDELSRRAEELLRRQHPEAFDARGRLRKRALARALASRFGGTRLTGEQIDQVIAAGRAATARRRGAG